MLKVLLVFIYCSVSFAAIKDINWQDKQYIKKAFFEIVYKNEYQSGLQKLKRWQKNIIWDINYFKLTAKINIVEKLITLHFNDLSSITGVKIFKKNKHKQKENFKIILTKREFYKKAIEKYTSNKIKDLYKTSNCLLYFRYDFSYGFNSVVVIIPVDYVMSNGLLPSCIVEELTQAMGLVNDSDWVNPSVANDVSINDLLSGLDYLMLKILYDKRLLPGMDTNESSSIVDEILTDFIKQGIIESSVIKARKLEIAKFLQ